MTATETERQAFERQIRECPADDTVRLVYADWLDEHGEGERAEFVRVQVAAARWDGTDTGPDGGAAGPEHLALRRREWGLWRGVADADFGREGLRLGLEPRLAWLAGHDPGPPQMLVRRGFVAEVRLPLAAFLAHAPALFARHPITEIVLTDRWPARPDRAHPEGPLDCHGWYNPSHCDDPVCCSPDQLTAATFSPGPEDVSGDIWTLVTGHRHHPGTMPHWKWFDDAPAAGAALSATLVDYARSLVDPPLPPLVARPAQAV